MRIATFNVNSIRSRQERVLSWLEQHQVDVLCLQELKCETETFMAMAPRFEQLGYHCHGFGQKTYNGVAIITKHEVAHVSRDFNDGVDDPQARFIEVHLPHPKRPGELWKIMSAYMPNGGEVGGPRYAHKLEWFKRMRAYLDMHHRPDEMLLLCGDSNIAIHDNDAHHVNRWKDSVLMHPQPRAGLAHVLDFGLHDSMRKIHPQGHVYSWWDYRGRGFEKNDGLRIDHIFSTDSLFERVTDAWVDRQERTGEKPSDHAPVVVHFDGE